MPMEKFRMPKQPTHQEQRIIQITKKKDIAFMHEKKTKHFIQRRRELSRISGATKNTEEAFMRRFFMPIERLISVILVLLLKLKN